MHGPAQQQPINASALVSSVRWLDKLPKLFNYYPGIEVSFMTDTRLQPLRSTSMRFLCKFQFLQDHCFKS